MKYIKPLVFLAAISFIGLANAQIVLKPKSPQPAKQVATDAPAPPVVTTTVRPKTAPKVDASVKQPTVAPVPQPPMPVAISVAATLRSAAANLLKENAEAKSNVDLARLAAAADIKLDAKLADVIQEPVSVYYAEKESVLGGLFGKIKKAASVQNDPNQLYADGRKVIATVKQAGKLRFAGASTEIIEAVLEYAAARQEVVDLYIFVANDVEAMQLENKYSKNEFVRRIEVLPRQKSRSVWIYAYDRPQRQNEAIVRDFLEVQGKTSSAVITKPTSPSQSAQDPAAALSNAADLCPDSSNFFTRNLCEAKLCAERADLNDHPACVKIRELQQNQKRSY